MSRNQENNQNQQLTDEEQQYLLKCYDEYYHYQLPHLH